VEHNAYDLIMGPMALLTKQMMNGKNNAKYVALEEAIKRRDADIYLRGSDRIDIAVGRSQSELQASARQFAIATLTSTSIQIVVKMHGFKENRGTDESSDADEDRSTDSDDEEAIKFTGRYDAKQFVHIRTSISKAAVKKKPSIKREKEEAD
jgi:hypothetical protein